jgi:hypothetical protein
MPLTRPSSMYQSQHVCRYTAKASLQASMRTVSEPRDRMRETRPSQETTIFQVPTRNISLPFHAVPAQHSTDFGTTVNKTVARTIPPNITSVRIVSEVEHSPQALVVVSIQLHSIHCVPISILLFSYRQEVTSSYIHPSLPPFTSRKKEENKFSNKNNRTSKDKQAKAGYHEQTAHMKK